MSEIQPPTLTELREAVTSRFDALFAKADVAGHAGRFGTEDLRRFILKSPAIRVAILGLDAAREESGGSTVWPVRMAAFLVTRDAIEAGKGKIPRDEAAMNMVGALVTEIHENRFGVLSEPAERVRAKNLHSDTLQEKGATLFAIDWIQPVPLTSDAFQEEGVVPTDLYLGIAPEIGTEHVDDYIQITGGEDDG